jgi:predicted Zn-dependent protease
MIQQRIALLPVDARSGSVGRAAFMQRLDGLAYGEDPRQGFFSEANVFHHPELAFRVEFPSDWKTVNQRQRVAALSPEQDAVIQLSLAEGDDPEEVARQFVASDGVSGAAPQRTSVNGLVAANAEFTASADGTPIRGLATFVKHGDHVFGLLGYAPQSKFGARLTALRGALASFARETDPAVLGAQPWRIDVVSPERRMSQAAFARAYPGPASADELALLNQLDAGEFYPAGAPAKRIVGQALPR